MGERRSRAGRVIIGVFFTTRDFEREAYHLLEYFANVRNEDLAGLHELGSFLVLDIDP